MESLCIDLTEDENHLSEDTKPEILYDSTIIQNNVSKAMKSILEGIKMACNERRESLFEGSTHSRLGGRGSRGCCWP